MDSDTGNTLVTTVERIGISSTLVLAIIIAMGWLLVRLFGKKGLVVKWFEKNMGVMETTEKSMTHMTAGIAHLDNEIQKANAHASECNGNHQQFLEVATHACDLLEHLVASNHLPEEVKGHVTRIRETVK